MAQKRKAVDAELEDGSPSSKQASGITLAYPSLSHAPSKPPPFQQPTQLLTFSYTPDHVLQFDDSALRYYIDPPRGADLGYGYDRWIRRPDERGRLDSLLHAWSRFKKSLCEGPSLSQSRAPDIHVMSWRGIMTKILIAPYEERGSWELNVMRVGGTLYFEEHLSDAALKEKNEMGPHHRRQTYYGYAFESYCTTSTPGHREDASSHVPGWGGDVNTNVQWCSVVKTKLGDRRIVIGGEVDCVRGKYSGNTANFVELKTSLTIRGSADETKFEKKTPQILSAVIPSGGARNRRWFSQAIWASRDDSVVPNRRDTPIRSGKAWSLGSPRLPGLGRPISVVFAQRPAREHREGCLARSIHAQGRYQSCQA